MDKEKYPSKERTAEAHSGTEVFGEMFIKDGMNFSKRGSQVDVEVGRMPPLSMKEGLGRKSRKPQWQVEKPKKLTSDNWIPVKWR